MAARNDGKDTTDPKGSEKKGAGDQLPDGAGKAEASATAEVEKALGTEQGQGFRGVETDLTPNENYTVAGVTSGADVPEAHANKATAQADATNPVLQHPLSPH